MTALTFLAGAVVGAGVYGWLGAMYLAGLGLTNADAVEAINRARRR